MRRQTVAAIAAVMFAGPALAQNADAKALHDALRLSSPQESAWQAYSATVAMPETVERRRQAASRLFPTLPAPRRIDLVQSEMEQELADLKQQSVALKTFYAALTPAQQRIFDDRTLPSGRDQPPPR